jgi:hypothetical protein
MLHALIPNNKVAYLSQENLLPKANEFDNPFVNLRRNWAIRGSIGFSLANKEQKNKKYCKKGMMLILFSK